MPAPRHEAPEEAVERLQVDGQEGRDDEGERDEPERARDARDHAAPDADVVGEARPEAVDEALQPLLERALHVDLGWSL